MSLSALQLLLEKVFIVFSLSIQDFFMVSRYGARDNFLSKIRPNILMVSVKFISRLFRYSLGGVLSLVFLVNKMSLIFWEKILSPFFCRS